MAVPSLHLLIDDINVRQSGRCCVDPLNSQVFGGSPRKGWSNIRTVQSLASLVATLSPVCICVRSSVTDLHGRATRAEPGRFGMARQGTPMILSGLCCSSVSSHSTSCFGRRVVAPGRWPGGLASGQNTGRTVLAPPLLTTQPLHSAVRDFRFCQTKPVTAPSVMTAPIAMNHVTRVKTTPIVPYNLLSEMTVEEK